MSAEAPVGEAKVPEPDGWGGSMRPLRRVRRLAVVVLVALAGFYAAVVNFRSAAEEGCVQKGVRDRSVTARIDPRPASSIRRYHLTVMRSGRPITGARVCMSVDMSVRISMSGMVLVAEGREVSRGVYDIDAAFPMGGGWTGRVLVRERGRDPVAVPITFEVL